MLSVEQACALFVLLLKVTHSIPRIKIASSAIINCTVCFFRQAPSSRCPEKWRTLSHEPESCLLPASEARRSNAAVDIRIAPATNRQRGMQHCTHLDLSFCTQGTTCDQLPFTHLSVTTDQNQMTVTPYTDDWHQHTHLVLSFH